MPLERGHRLGPYEILSPLGAGGMGEVYSARDTRLGRTVAIKVLPAEKTVDEERKLRFFREAQAASALNHPNIVTVYDLSSSDGVDLLVMEHLAGTPLDRLAGRGGLPLETVLLYSAQIADALAAAHAAGIIHRDIKPGNIMVTDHGIVKVLDFGLAKLIRADGAGDMQETRTIGPDTFATREAAILGTAAYMSPEQARGEKVDRRSDIFSFGLVLYELATGVHPLARGSVMETISAVLKDEPRPAREIRPELPVQLEAIMRRCLRKDAARRFQCIDDVRVELLEITEAAQTPLAVAAAASSKMPRLFAAAAVAVLLAGAIWWFTAQRAIESPLAAVPLTSYPGSERFATFSPDGSQVAFSWDGETQDNFDLYVKLIGTGAPLRVTRDPAPDFYPAWSPDGRWIAFLRLLASNRAAVVLVPPLGGPERRIAETTLYPSVAYVQGVNPPRIAWSADSSALIVVDRESPGQPFGLFSLSLDTGEKRRLTLPPDLSIGDSGPAVSPDGGSVVFTRTPNNVGAGDLYLLRLTSGLAPAGEAKRLTRDNGQNGHAVWTADGRDIVFTSARLGGTLGLWRIAATGSGEPQRLPAVGEDGLFPAISRQRNRMVYTKYALDSNIWRIDLQSAKQNGEAAGIPLVTSTRQDVMPRFSPDGRRVAFGSDRSGYFQVWVSDADGSNAVQLTTFEGVSWHPAWSPDGQRIAFATVTGGRAGIYVVNAGGGKPRLLTDMPGNKGWPSFSHDGKWVYFSCNRSGRDEVWKSPTQGGEAIQVTNRGGAIPVASADGRFLYYLRRFTTGPLYRVPISGGEETEMVGTMAARGYAVTDEGIYFILPPPDLSGQEYYEVNARNTVQFFSFASGNTRMVATLQKPLQLGVTVSPDERWLLYPQIDQHVEDLMIVEGFR